MRTRFVAVPAALMALAVGVSPPLWEGAAPAFSVHLELRPPVEVPLVGEPEVADVAVQPIGLPVPRRTTERPPVPSRGAVGWR